MGVTAQPLRKRRSRPAAIFPNVAFQRFRLPLGRVRHEAGCNAEEPFSDDTRAASLDKGGSSSLPGSITQRLQ